MFRLPPSILLNPSVKTEFQAEQSRSLLAQGIVNRVRQNHFDVHNQTIKTSAEQATGVKSTSSSQGRLLPEYQTAYGVAGRVPLASAQQIEALTARPQNISTDRGSLNGNVQINAVVDAVKDFGRNINPLASIIRTFERAVDKMGTSTTRFLFGNRGAGGAGGGGGGGDDGGGGFEDFLKRLGRKDRNGLRGGLAGFGIKTAGDMALAGATAYNNYQLQMADASVQTYSNISALSGFQQRRFLRDFTDFSPEALVLRQSSLRFGGAEDITRRIDKVAQETTKRKDEAEQSAYIKEVATKIGSEITSGVLSGAASAGKGGALAGGVGAGLTSIANEAANIFNNPVAMRMGLGGGDLYAKNKSQFQTQNIMQYTKMMEGAVADQSAIDIEILRNYLGSVPNRLSGMQQGRFYDVVGQMVKNAPPRYNVSDQPILNQIKNYAAQPISEMPGFFDAMAGMVGYETENKRKYYESLKTSGARAREQGLLVQTRDGKFVDAGKLIGLGAENLALSAGTIKDMSRPQSEQILERARSKEQALRAQGVSSFEDVLAKMGYAASSAEAGGIMSELSRVGGAGAGRIGAGDYKSLELVRQMSLSGRGSAEQLLGQAGILGRLSGGVTAEQNIKKLEEVMSKAVAIGMDNSELGSAFIQNVAQMAAQTRSSDVSEVARLVAQMQRAGGGQQIDFERMRRSYATADDVRQNNIGVKTYVRDNLANAFGKMGFGVRESAIGLTAFEDIKNAELAQLPAFTEKFLAAKDDKSALEAIRNAPSAIFEILRGLGQKRARQLGVGGDKFMKTIRSGIIAGHAFGSPEKFKKATGYDITDFEKMPYEKQQSILDEAFYATGSSSRMFLDLVKGVSGDVSGEAINPEDVKRGERLNLRNIQRAINNNALTAASKENESVFNFLSRNVSSAGGAVNNLRQVLRANPRLMAGLNKEDILGLEEVFANNSNAYGQFGGALSEDQVKKLSDRAKQAYGKLSDLTVGEAEGGASIQSAAQRPGGLTIQDAALLGKEFAKAFFAEMNPFSRKEETVIAPSQNYTQGVNYDPYGLGTPTPNQSTINGK